MATSTSTNKTATRKTATRKPATKTSASTSTQPRTRVEQVQEIAERAFLVPVGATLIARDDLVSTVKGISTKYRSRAGVEKELKRFERRGVTARNRLERQVRRTRTKFEREMRQRRARVEKSVKQNRRQLEKQVKAVRKDLDKQTGQFSTQVEKLVNDVQERLNFAS
jgi:hypothetical protein